jgi:hypothetical protein
MSTNDKLKDETANGTKPVLGAVTVDEREKDIQRLCNAVKEMSIQSTGDYGSGGQCPFCYKDCRWDANDVMEIDHEPHCAVLIAKDLSVGMQ